MPLDLRPLENEPTRDQIAAVRQRAKGGAYGPSSSWVSSTLAALIAAFVVVVFVIVGTTVIPQALTSSSMTLRGFAVFWLGALAWGVVRLASGRLRHLGRTPDWVSGALFADANGLDFERRGDDPGFPGAIFGHGSSRHVVDHTFALRGRFADAGTYVYTTGSGDDSKTHRWGYAAFRLPRTLPHLVLDARANNRGFSNLPASYAPGQRLTLGHPFDGRYTTYAPNGYGFDTFRLLPSDLQDALLRLPDDIDVEIVDGWLFLYSNGSLGDSVAETWRIIAWADEAIAARLERLASGYSDEGTPLAPHSVQPLAGEPQALADWRAQRAARSASEIAPQGRRLRTSWLRTAVTVAGFILIWLVVTSGVFGHMTSDLLGR